MEELAKMTGHVSVLDSREVAEMIGKTHAHLCRDIDLYAKVISENPKLDSQNFFIERTYKTDGNNKTYKRYDITKQGCEMVANKLTGEKGILFTAEYVKRFNEMESPDSYMIADPIERAKAWIKEQEKYRGALDTVKAQTALIEKLEPKASYTDKILASADLVTTTAIAKDYGMSAQQLNNLLKGLKILFKRSGQWFLYAKYQNAGYTSSDTISFTHKNGEPGSKMHTKWTQTGRKFLYDKLKEIGILPMIERQVTE